MSDGWRRVRDIDGGTQVEWERMHASDDGVACCHVVGCHGGSWSCHQRPNEVDSMGSQSVLFFRFQVFLFGCCHQVMTIGCFN